MPVLRVSLHVFVYPLSDPLDVHLEFLGLDYLPSLPLAAVAVGSAFLASSLFIVGFHCCTIKIRIKIPFRGMADSRDTPGRGTAGGITGPPAAGTYQLT